ncbi:MAG: ABC transporter ATP-binding protein [Proteobacteria bacterium]|nr:ABC transporter ATP-binding protein [Pseudomonadota bacterium]MDA0845788.1 ABC transporter ATP-binding protein [Pseudomonadota bacterium]
MNLLSTHNLSRKFGGITAVDNISFVIPTGQVRALIGPNGAGKTTFVSMLSGRIAATEGQVFFDGIDVTKEPAHLRIRAGMAYTFQITSIYGRLSVFENVALAVRWQTIGDENETKRRVEDALAEVGISDRATQLAGDLSYGHQRLLEIAMGLCQRPKLLILDEPTQGLADSEINQFIRLISNLRGVMTILLIEHNIDVVMRSADAITVLNNGKVLAEGSPKEIHENAAVQAAYLGTS